MCFIPKNGCRALATKPCILILKPLILYSVSQNHCTSAFLFGKQNGIKKNFRLGAGIVAHPAKALPATSASMGVAVHVPAAPLLTHLPANVCGKII